MNNLVIYGLIALLVLLVLFKGRSYFTPGPAPEPAPAPAPIPAGKKWAASMVIKAGENCPDSTWTKLGPTICAK